MAGRGSASHRAAWHGPTIHLEGNMKTNLRKPIILYIVKHGRQHHIKYRHHGSTKGETLHVLHDGDEAKLYSEGVFDGLKLAAQLLDVHTVIGHTEGDPETV